MELVAQQATHPGETVSCPPGEEHWHGAAPAAADRPRGRLGGGRHTIFVA